jgi:DNA-binding response OmpR family regulator
VAAVLIVDDADSIRLLCRINLELEGHAVREAASVDAARRELAEGDVDVILLDVHVGPDDGRDFLREVRESHPDVRVAMLTGSVDSDAVRSVGADALLPKPFELDDLKATVRELAESRQPSRLSAK